MTLDTRPIYYKAGYAYVLQDAAVFHAPELHGYVVDTKFVRLQHSEMLVRRGFAWDGASGPALDEVRVPRWGWPLWRKTRSIVRGSLFHDAGYYLLRHGHLHPSMRSPVDDAFKRICRDDGMSRIRARWVHRGVREGGGPSASPSARREVRSAP